MSAMIEFPPPTHLEKFRTNDYVWYFDQITEVGNDFFKLRDKIYMRIDALEVGRRYDLFALQEKDQENFVRLACYYIIEHGGIQACGVEFSNDWRYLHRKFKHEN